MGFAERMDRIIASPGFRRFAAGFPGLRWVARRRSKHLFDLMAGFVYSQTLLACARYELPDRLLERPRTRDELAEITGLPADRLDRLIKAARALDIVRERSRDRIGLGQVGRDLAQNAAALSMIEHHVAFYADMRDPMALLSGAAEDRAVRASWPYLTQKHAIAGDAAADYSLLMSRSQEGLAEEILDDYNVAGRRHIVDVGGGNGNFLSVVARRADSTTHLTLFDLPPVADGARSRLEKLGLGGRIETVGGDFLETPLPEGADLVTLIRVLFDHPDGTVRPLLAAVRRALASDGALLIAEPISETPGGERIADTYFGFYLMAMGDGRTRTEAEHRALLREAGFTRVRFPGARMPHMARLIEARP
jgi:demethylspheroidene O-methyltransferase